MKNPQNTQYFGDFRPYPLELNDFHRFIIPNFQNTVANDNVFFYVVNNEETYLISGIAKVVDGILKYVTFSSSKAIAGRLEIRDSNNVTLFYSNCIEFLDSTDENGRKFVKVATKHTYNRNLFDFQSPNAWIITNLPAYSLGLNSVEAEINNARTGGISTLKTRETYIDELTEYEFISGGDSNVLNFIQVHVTNNEFYIDDTKRTSIDKIDRDEFSISGKIKLTNVKDKNGFNIFIDPNILNDIYDSIYADNITYNFTYSHEPENDPNSGEWFLANLLYNNYHNPFGITLDCDLKFILKSVPAKGFLAHNTTNQIFAPDDVISYCEKDNLVYYPNGFNNDLGVSGNYIENFTYRIIDQGNRTGRLITHTFNMTDSAAPEIDLSASITWFDDTSAPIEGTLGNIIVKLASLIFDPADPIVTQQWEVWNGTEWVFYADKTADSQTIALPYEFNQIRLKVVSQYSVTAYSNILAYTKTAVANIYITDIVKNTTLGRTSYKLHVENETFNGFVNMFGMKNSSTKNASVEDDKGGPLYIPADNDFEPVYESVAVSIPVGVYSLLISTRGAPISMYQDVEVVGGVSYGYTGIYDDSTVKATVRRFIPANEV